MIQRIYQVDAFTNSLFAGNPAAVCPLKEWLPDELLQNIALENNLSETAFYVKQEEQIEIRWFTPVAEVALCGHATLATAFVLFNHERYVDDTINFYSKLGGVLPVTRTKEGLTMNFPTDPVKEIPLDDDIRACFNLSPLRSYQGGYDLMLVFDSQKTIRNLKPNFQKLKELDTRGVIVTAKGDDVDFVSRFFVPKLGIDEDPVTGSAHTTLTPFWAKRLAKNELKAHQLSPRGGQLSCKFLEKRVEISGRAKLYMIGEIFI